MAFTPEQLEKARQAKLDKPPATKIRVSADDDYWVGLAKKHGVRLPQKQTPLATGPMRRWLRQLGITNKQWLEESGNMTLKQYADTNIPLGFGLRAFVGLRLETLDSKKE